MGPRGRCPSRSAKATIRSGRKRRPRSPVAVGPGPHVLSGQPQSEGQGEVPGLAIAEPPSRAPSRQSRACRRCIRRAATRGAWSRPAGSGSAGRHRSHGSDLSRPPADLCPLGDRLRVEPEIGARVGAECRLQILREHPFRLFGQFHRSAASRSQSSGSAGSVDRREMSRQATTGSESYPILYQMEPGRCSGRCCHKRGGRAASIDR